MGEVRRQPSPFQEPRALLELSELDISPAPAAGRGLTRDSPLPPPPPLTPPEWARVRDWGGIDGDWERRTATPLNRHADLLNDRWARCHVLIARDTSTGRLGATSDETAEKWSPKGLVTGFRSPGCKRIRFSTSGRKREFALKFREVKNDFFLKRLLEGGQPLFQHGRPNKLGCSMGSIAILGWTT